ncbi:tetratricopeptide repeat protein [uncultured Alistipes sp.]|uniref:tetratricopeptide repeat protein n=1 Tax=uncultured Alistipes sp. TaxID=538949 RepID=UPI00261BE7C6|nr:tetratricopeptide repeat protein [uncultured Alistipes sp.]
MRKILYIVLVLAAALPAAAQKYPERSLVRKGNRAFAKERYDRAVDRYKTAVERTPGSWEATYNLGNALYRTEQFDAAAQALQAAAADTLRPAADRAEAYYNLGDVQFRQQKLAESLESFKSALRLNPADEQAKYNYAYVKRLLQQQENENQDQNQNQDQQQDQNQQQDQDQNRDRQDQDDRNQNQDQDDQQQDRDRQPEPGGEQSGQEDSRPQEGRISPQEQERMLEAIQAQEDETQEKLKEKAGVVVRGKKNW